MNRKVKTQPQNGTVKSGINFSLGDFIKRPVAGMLFFTTVGVGGLVVNQKNIYDYEFGNYECDYIGDDTEAIKLVVSYFGEERAKTVKRKNGCAISNIDNLFN